MSRARRRTSLRARIGPAVHGLAYATGLSTLLARCRGGTRIVMYHGVRREDASAFAAQIAYLARRYRIVPLREVVDGLARPDVPARGDRLALTFDDGLRNNYTVAYPILRRLGVTATFFVCPGLIAANRWLWNHEARERLRGLPASQRAAVCGALGAPSGDTEAVIEWMKTLAPRPRAAAEDTIRAATPRFAPSLRQRDECDVLAWDDVKALDPRIVEIGAHTVNHAVLTSLDDATARMEVEEGRRWLERELDRPVELFAYPNGDYDARVLARVRRTYRGAVSTVPGVVRPGADPHCLPRIAGCGDSALVAWRMHRPGA